MNSPIKDMALIGYGGLAVATAKPDLAAYTPNVHVASRTPLSFVAGRLLVAREDIWILGRGSREKCRGSPRRAAFSSR